MRAYHVINSMETKMKTDFCIENIDPLGQGVAKEEGQITFIKKTLPGEKGIAEITSSKKGVRFAKLVSISEKSPDRIDPVCSHYATCNGCDFLHTSYKKEVEYKLNNITRSLSFLGEFPIKFHEAKNRINYRNRIQLHYNKKAKVIGFLGQDLKIVPIEKCVIGNKAIQKKLQEIYANNLWLSFVQNAPVEGHIELYDKGGDVLISANSNYAQGGFTQVNFEMNQLLTSFLTQTIKSKVKESDILFDLFGGNGNLTAGLQNPTLVVDVYKSTPASKWFQVFFNQDLYQPKAIANIAQFYQKKPELIIFDPPRSGVKNIDEFLKKFEPNQFIYISCQFTSFTRDVKPILGEYKLTEVHIFDLFPGTHHFETVGIFTKNK